MTVTPGSPQMQVIGNTSVRSASLKRRRAVIGVCRTSVRVSVPYRPLEKLGVVPTCQSSWARAAAGSISEHHDHPERMRRRLQHILHAT